MGSSNKKRTNTDLSEYVENKKKKKKPKMNADYTSSSLPKLPQVMTVYLNLAQALVNPSTAESSQQLLQRIQGGRAWIAHKLFGFLVEKSLNPNVEFRRVEALELISEGLRSLVINMMFELKPKT
ncbi:hypothetical protein YC2023_026103 [Brassica napus]